MVPHIKWTLEEALAVRALLRDEAHQNAVRAILYKACGIRDLCFQAEGQGGQWDTAFHLGRRAVGLAIAQADDDTLGKKIAARQTARNLKRKEAENG